MSVKAYFDDSGTDEKSDVVVWGGVFGTTESFESLEAQWSKFLESPVEGRGPISKWATADCKNRKGEFEFWGQGEVDNARYNARQIIATSHVVPISYAIPKPIWEKHIRGRVKRAFGPPSVFAYAKCFDAALRLAERRGEIVDCVFDQGQNDTWLNEAKRQGLNIAQERGLSVTHTTMAVSCSYGLQAADFVATESFWWAVRVMREGNPEPDPHQRALFQETNPFGFYFNESGIVDLRSKWLSNNPASWWKKLKRHAI